MRQFLTWKPVTLICVAGFCFYSAFGKWDEAQRKHQSPRENIPAVSENIPAVMECIPKAPE